MYNNMCVSQHIFASMSSTGMSDIFSVQARTARGSSLVTSLSTLACSFMMSMSLFTKRTHQGRAGLEPLAGNICLLDSSGQVHHDGPFRCSQLACSMGSAYWQAYPDGMLLLERDTAQEMASCEARQQARDKKQHEGEPAQSLPFKGCVGFGNFGMVFTS